MSTPAGRATTGRGVNLDLARSASDGLRPPRSEDDGGSSRLPLSTVAHLVFGGRYLDGREVVVTQLSREQRRQLTARVVVVGVGPPAMHARSSRPAGAYRPVTGRWGVRWLAAWRQTRRLVAEDGGRCLLHAHGLRALATVALVRRVSPPRRRPVTVYTAHGSGGTAWQRTAQAWLERVLCGRVDRVMVCSALLAPALGRISRHRVHVVLNGVRQVGPVTSDDRVRARTLLGVRDAYPVIGIVGRLAPEKRHDVFLAAGTHLVRRFPAAQLLVAGDGPDRRQLTKLAKGHGLERHVRFLGHVDDVLPLYRSLDLLLHTSDVEGTPLAVVEAMRAGVPVVATAVGGVPAVVRDGVDGLLVPRREPVALAAAATMLLVDDDMRAGMGQAQRHRAGGALSLSRMCREVTEVYSAAVRG